MIVMLLEDYDYVLNDYSYKKGQLVQVQELEGFSKYARYHHDSVDWIPKDLVQIIEIGDDK